MKRIKIFYSQDPFEPLNDTLYRYYRDKLAKLLKKTSNRTADAIIRYLKQVPHGYRWDLFCWTAQNYALLQTDTSRLFKFSWLFGAPDERGVIMLRECIDPNSLMDMSESGEMDKLPEEVTVYKAIPAEDMEMAEDEEEEWYPGFDWKWSLDFGKTTYIASVLGEGYIVISTVISKSKILALFHGVDLSYELIAEGNCGMWKEYKIEADCPKRFLTAHPECLFDKNSLI